MPDRDPHQWQLLGFEELFEAWLAAEDLAGYGDLELIVWRWIFDRSSDPYAGARMLAPPRTRLREPVVGQDLGRGGQYGPHRDL